MSMCYISKDIIYRYIHLYILDIKIFSVFIVNFTFHLKHVIYLYFSLISYNLYIWYYIFKPIAFYITYMTSVNLVCYNFIKFSLLHFLYIICHIYHTISLIYLIAYNFYITYFSSHIIYVKCVSYNIQSHISK